MIGSVSRARWAPKNRAEMEQATSIIRMAIVASKL